MGRAMRKPREPRVYPQTDHERAISGYCSKSQRIDAPRHSWEFDGDDPYVICAWCRERRDAISGRLIK